jgi:hypothetical protein
MYCKEKHKVASKEICLQGNAKKMKYMPPEQNAEPNIMREIKSRRMRLAEHVAIWAKKRCVQDFGGKT